MSESTNTKQMNDLYKAIVAITEASEAKKFLRDICTISELKAISERWNVAKLVDKGVTYRKISEQTGASTATITRVAHWLNHGKGGYKLMLEKLK